MIAVRLGWGVFALNPDGTPMDFDSFESATAWAVGEGLYEGSVIETAERHGARGDALDGWRLNGLYAGAVIEQWEELPPVGGESWTCVASFGVLFPGALRCPRTATMPLGTRAEGLRTLPRSAGHAGSWFA